MFKPLTLLSRIIKYKYRSPYPIQSISPPHRRSVVLIILFIGQRGELRVLLTKRSRGLRSFSGHVSFPGGKADDTDQSFIDTGRREVEEEIGIPQDDELLNKEYLLSLEQLNVNLPCYLSTTFLSVKPLVFFLYNSNLRDENLLKYSTPIDGSKFKAKLNPGETSSIFSIPLSDLTYFMFYDSYDHLTNKYKPEYTKRTKITKAWGGLRWNVSHYYYPTLNAQDESWLNNVLDMSSDEEKLGNSDDNLTYKDVWGLTAKILYDLSRIAHGYISNNTDDKQNPSLNIKIGDEDLIYALHEFGKQMQSKSRTDWELAMLKGSKTTNYSDVLPKFCLEKLEAPSDYESGDQH
ncbi:hypothetical protein TPHA_0C00540 [Tetrapisispora phaffii CBS 4417]|uniref:Nudix hydrolase domain-containing protein n=1 Tax=Tetrapisispora phaffii (strain ATCC 24235 / CBS 4417 / NBRC 1672 / NRRL Y-8282 / UCD 70-5) TaxID=1071381 RepID=G8BR35_TETPH|nr:hypothetical protein TPHA_0C00540 [Tetrapisispora phaffii CBS 4417]CCE62211.1 hypothetical protein TPHA_0C00540 [Tetrapisispora phaffii CBS 4417]